MSVEEKKPMLTDEFIEFVEKEVAPEAIENAKGEKGSPAIRFEVTLLVDKETGELEVVNQDLSLGLLRDKEN